MDYSNMMIARAQKKMKRKQTAGICIACFFGLGVFSMCDPAYLAKPGGIGGLLVFSAIFVSGVMLIVLAETERMLIKMAQTYALVLSNRPQRSIAEIAAILGKSERKVTAELTQVLAKNFFPGAYIDRNTNCVVTGMRVEAKPAPETVSVICHACGAPNKIPKGTSGKCAYCDSVIRNVSIDYLLERTDNPKMNR